MYKMRQFNWSMFVLALILVTRTINGQQQSEFLVEDIDECEETVNGCICQQNWEFRTASFLPAQTYKGCNNPDNDPSGLWCMVDLDTCDNNGTDQILKQRIAVEGSLGTDIGYYDRCGEGCPEESGFPEFLDNCLIGAQALFGCSCLSQWTFGFGFQEQLLSYCENPDSDPGGKWCKIDSSRPCELGELERLDMLTRDPDTLEILSYWAYCSLDCGGLVRPQIFANTAQSSVQSSTSSQSSSSSSSQSSSSPSSQSSSSSPYSQSSSSSSSSASRGGFMGSG
eukprot:TRINITY_DN5776_c0_g1_i2.p1 TRINITY_DN5776_c0_g1~~TRINITY_DN5776_c0_g1_i2.p1  ORF type:complete len:282 (+),score=23.56 TRINITY_DN5776_c0_g1_i2:86-931(+)